MFFFQFDANKWNEFYPSKRDQTENLEVNYNNIFVVVKMLRVDLESVTDLSI